MNLQNNIIKKYTPENITKLLPNEVFVFGDNEAGIHGAGAALIAFKKFGAVWGIHVAYFLFIFIIIIIHAMN